MTGTVVERVGKKSGRGEKEIGDADTPTQAAVRDFLKLCVTGE